MTPSRGINARETTVLIMIVTVVALLGVITLVSSANSTKMENTIASSSNQSSMLTNSSFSISQSVQWQVVKTNTTVYYGTVCMIIYLFGPASCPTLNTAMHSPSLTNVAVIRYLGNEYYDMNYTRYFNNQPTTHTVWFTNSSVFCVSPSIGAYNLCPK